MSEQLKYIVQELTKAPYNKAYNLISFDGLDSIQLIQNLSDICAEVESKVRLPICHKEEQYTLLLRN